MGRLLSTAEIERRKPLWVAFSRLFLDTDIDDMYLEYVARLIVQSRFSIEEVREIFFTEVYPVCVTENFRAAGAWAALDKEFLFREIQERLRSPSPAGDLFNGIVKTKWAVSEHWKKILEALVDVQND
jgi:hypothetical protein